MIQFCSTMGGVLSKQIKTISLDEIIDVKLLIPSQAYHECSVHIPYYYYYFLSHAEKYSHVRALPITLENIPVLV